MPGKINVKKLILIICTLMAAVITLNEQHNNFTKLKSPNLGQKPTGNVPEMYTPGNVSIVYLENSSAVFTPDGNELFWSREINLGRSPRIIVVTPMKQENGVWSKPERVPFNFNTAVYNHMNSIFPDGRHLFFLSSNLLNHEKDLKEESILIKNGLRFRKVL